MTILTESPISETKTKNNIWAVVPVFILTELEHQYIHPNIHIRARPIRDF